MRNKVSFFFLEPLYSKVRYMNMFKKQSMRTVHSLQCYFFYRNSCINITSFPEGTIKQLESSVWENQDKCNNVHYNLPQFQARWLKIQTSVVPFSLCIQLL